MRQEHAVLGAGSEMILRTGQIGLGARTATLWCTEYAALCLIIEIMKQFASNT
jgi:hypothetical protein